MIFRLHKSSLKLLCNFQFNFSKVTKPKSLSELRSNLYVTKDIYQKKMPITNNKQMLLHNQSYNIYIEVQKTPNPNFLKFIPEGQIVLGTEGTLDISDVKYAEVSPLAKKLFGIEGIVRVFYGSDYMSIAKQEDLDWEALKPQVYSLISDHYEKKWPLFIGEVAIDDGEIDPNDPEIVQFIKQVLGSRVRPTIQEDGGDVKFVSFDEEKGKLILKLTGACSSCPSSTVTLKNGIEKMLTYYIKEVKEVVAQD